jgi:ribokinase
MSKKILVIGSCNMDMITQVENMPVAGETILGSGLQYIPGGKGANQASAVGSLGGNVTMLGCIGRDDFGKLQLMSLQNRNVDVTSLKQSSKSNTGIAIIYINKHGNNSIVVIPGANSEVDIEYLKQQDHHFKECDFVLLQMEIPLESIYYAINRAHELGKTVILNPAPAPDSIPDEILSKIDYLTPNETEISKLSNRPVNNIKEMEEAAKVLLNKGVKNLLITMGEKGACLVNHNTTKVFETREVNAVDTTAAGDCFNGAFVVALSEGMEHKDAIEFANIASAIAVTRKGAQSSIPVRQEVDFMNGSKKADI